MPDASGTTNVIYVPVPAQKDIEQILGYHGYPKKSRLIDLTTEPHPYYASLGAMDDFTDALLGWCYDRQRACDPGNKPYYLDCLRDLAKGRSSEDLNLKVALAESNGEVGLSEIEASYRYLGIDPNSSESEDYILNCYRARVVSAPKQKSDAKKALLMIGHHRYSTRIQAIAQNNMINLNDAFEILGVAADVDSESIGAAAVALVRIRSLFCCHSTNKDT